MSRVSGPQPIRLAGSLVQHREGRSRARRLCGSQAAGRGSSAQMSGDSKGGAISQCGRVFSGAAVSHRQPIDCCDTTTTVVMRGLRCTMRRERGGFWKGRILSGSDWSAAKG